MPESSNDDLRAQFLAAEELLAKSVTTLSQLRSTIETLDEVRAAIADAGESLHALYQPFSAGMELLQAGVSHLGEGLALIRATDTVAVRRRLDEVDAGAAERFERTMERLELLDRRAASRSRRARQEKERCQREQLERLIGVEKSTESAREKLDGVLRTLDAERTTASAQYDDLSSVLARCAESLVNIEKSQHDMLNEIQGRRRGILGWLRNGSAAGVSVGR